MANQFEMGAETAQPPKRGMSTGAKVLIALGVIFGALILLCCGGVITVIFYVRSAVSQDPAVVAAKTQEITRIDIPEGLDPQQSFDMNIPFSGKRLTWVAYVDEQTDSALILFEMGGVRASQDQEQMRRAMDESLRQQGMQQQREKLVDVKSHPKEVQIRGQPATFTIEKGVGADSQKPRIQVTGAFQGEGGPAMLLFGADAQKFTEEQIVEMIDSIE